MRNSIKRPEADQIFFFGIRIRDILSASRRPRFGTILSLREFKKDVGELFEGTLPDDQLRKILESIPHSDTYFLTQLGELISAIESEYGVKARFKN